MRRQIFELWTLLGVCTLGLGVIDANAVTLRSSDGIYTGVSVGTLENGLSGAQNYNYIRSQTSGTPIAFDTVRNTAILWLTEHEGTLSLGSIFDRRNDGSGGRIKFTLQGVANSTAALIDDPEGVGARPNEGFIDPITKQRYQSPNAVFVGGTVLGDFGWDACCTDGAVVNAAATATSFGFSLTPDSNSSVANSVVGLRDFLVYSFIGDQLAIFDVSQTIRNGGTIWFDLGLDNGGNGGDGGNGGGGEPISEPGTLLLCASGLAALRAKRSVSQ